MCMWLFCVAVSSIRGFERAPGRTSMCCGLRAWEVVALQKKESHRGGNTGILACILDHNRRVLSCRQCRCHTTEFRLTVSAKEPQRVAVEEATNDSILSRGLSDRRVVLEGSLAVDCGVGGLCIDARGYVGSRDSAQSI